MLNFEGFQVHKDNLLPFLSPTSTGTQWYESPPEGVVTNRGTGRVLLQFHQLAEIIDVFSSRFEDINFLDIGTGNGLLPNLVADFLGAHLSVGLDPYEDGEHETSWAKMTRSKLFDSVVGQIDRQELNFEKYQHLLSFEEYFKPPKSVKLMDKRNDWNFEKCFLEDYDPHFKFNILFAKCIDHIHDWSGLFAAANRVSDNGAILVIKHNSFFSFNGAHRYASTFIPWGHVLLNENQYERYVKEFHAERSETMLNFYYNGLSYRRKSISELIKILTQTGWNVLSVEKSVAKKNNAKLDLAGGVGKLMNGVHKNYEDVSVDELISGRIFLIAEKM